MKIKVLLLVLLATGCAKVSDYQNECESRYTRLSDMANCLDLSIKKDSRMSSSATSKLYALAAKTLGQAVDEGKISDTQARLELQSFYANLQRQEYADQQLQAQAMQNALLNYQSVNTMQAIEQNARQPAYVPPVLLQNNNVTTNCTTYGNQTNCQSY